MSREIHTIPPVFDSHSKILILGSFPSVKSRESQFFYGHPQNRFWRVLAAVTGQPLPSDIAEKKGISAEKPYRFVGRHRKLRDNGVQRQFHPECSSK